MQNTVKIIKIFLPIRDIIFNGRIEELLCLLYDECKPMPYWAENINES